MDEAADQIARDGQYPSVARVRHLIGQGSSTTIADQLKVWRSRQIAQMHSEASPLPEYLLEANRVLLEQAKVSAMAQFAEERTGYCEEIVSLRNAVFEAERLRLELMSELSLMRVSVAEKNSMLENFSAELSSVQAANAYLQKAIEVAQVDADAKAIEQANAITKADELRMDVERRTLAEIERARVDAKDAIAYAHRKSSEYDATLERMRVSSLEERTALNNTIHALHNDVGRLTATVMFLENARRKTSSHRLGFRPSRAASPSCSGIKK